MRIPAISLAILILLVVAGCSYPGRVARLQPLQPSPGTTVVVPCDLARFAEEKDLWGAKVFVTGVYVTDHQSFAYLKGNCREEQISGVELAQVPEPLPPDLKIREVAVEKACRNKSFCVYRADVAIEGILLRDDNADFGVLIRPTRYLEWSIRPEP